MSLLAQSDTWLRNTTFCVTNALPTGLVQYAIVPQYCLRCFWKCVHSFCCCFSSCVSVLAWMATACRSVGWFQKLTSQLALPQVTQTMMMTFPADLVSNLCVAEGAERSRLNSDVRATPRKRIFGSGPKFPCIVCRIFPPTKTKGGAASARNSARNRVRCLPVHAVWATDYVQCGIGTDSVRCGTLLDVISQILRRKLLTRRPQPAPPNPVVVRRTHPCVLPKSCSARNRSAMPSC